MTATAKKVAVIGASGCAGGELLRCLLAHPGVEVVLAASSSGSGAALADTHPALRGLTNLSLEKVPGPGAWPQLDLVFLCLPHGASRDLVPTLPAEAKVIDLGGDFRLQDAEAFASFYGCEPPPAALQATFVYGLAEVTPAGEIAAARRIANPGCFASACILALAPLLERGLIEARVIIDAKTGSSGSGAKPSASTQHAGRVNSLYAYKSYTHQHLPEIRQALAKLAPGWGEELVLQAHSTPLVRGIFATAYAQLKPGIAAAAVDAAFHEAYAAQPFIRLADHRSPNTNWSRGSNFVDIGWVSQGRELTVFASLDNLGKGAAGQAVQNMNLMFGLPQATGLWHAGGVI